MTLTPELQLLIERCANAYFWVFIVIMILNFIIVSSNNYEEYKLNAIKNGTYFDKANINTTILRWVLFVLSIYYS